MDLSIIVPAYNIEEHLPRCLHSLLEQDLDPNDYEIIVVDDGSSDGSLRVAETIARSHPNIVTHSQPNQGLSAARNAGMRLARGRYLFFVDGDDYIAEDVLGSTIRLARRDDLQVLGFEHAIVGPTETLRGPRHGFEVSTRLDVTTGRQYVADHHYMNAVWWYIAERQLVETIGLAFEVGRLVEDALFTANLLCATSRFAFAPVDVYRYVRRPGSIMQTNSVQHTRRLVADYERVVAGLDELRERLVAEGASDALVDRLEYRREAYVFFLIGRVIRSDVPARAVLTDALSRMQAVGCYPLKRFPGRDYRGAQYRILTFIFNRGFLLYPFLRAYRALHSGKPVVFRQG